MHRPFRFPQSKLCLRVLVLSLSLVAGLRAQTPPDLTAAGAIAALKASTLAGAKPAYGDTYNLGATGLRGWIYVGGGNSADGTITVQSRQILVTVASTPGSAELAVDDVILGAMAASSGTVPDFTGDARKALGTAIGEAEKTGAGTLRVKRWRAGTTTDVNIAMTIMGDYTATAPYACPKSQLILTNARNKLVGQLLADPNFLSVGYAYSRAIHGLALLAGVAPGDPHYAEVQSRLQTFARALAATTPNPSGLYVWEWGYNGIFLSEYYLRTVADGTPDAQVLTGLNHYTVALAKVQSRYGTYGHGGSLLKADGSLHGTISPYGPVNSAGIPANIAIVLGKKALLAAGQPIDPEIDPAIQRGSDFFAWFVNKGSIPYGEHEPYLENHSSNGKDASCAVLFGLQAGRTAETEYFSRMTTSSFNSREDGHTGQGFSYLWSAMGANMGGSLAAAEHLKQVRWHLDLQRRTDGSFAYDSKENGGGGTTADGTYLGACGYFDMNPTACYLLTYALPLKRLHITGKDADPANTLDATKVANAISAATFKHDCPGFTITRLIASLSAFDPCVRNYGAIELAKRSLSAAELTTLRDMVSGTDANGRMGACQALGLLQDATALPMITRRIDKNIEPNSWVRAKAASAIRSYPPATASTHRDAMLAAFAANATDPEAIVWDDPIQFSNNYLSFALFGDVVYGGNNIASYTINAPKNLLYPAVKAGLKQPDSNPRFGAAQFCYDHLTLPDVQALALDIFEVITTKSQADTMWSVSPQLTGIALLKKHNCAEGLPMALSMMDVQPGWGHSSGGYLPQVLDNLATYGDSARWIIPFLNEDISTLQPVLNPVDYNPTVPKIQSTIATIENATTSPSGITHLLPLATPQVVSTTGATGITLAGTSPRSAVTFTNVTAPAHGTLTGTAPNLTYTPNGGYTGPDHFTFQAVDNLTTSEPGTVSIIVGTAGTGLKAEYYDNAEFTNLKLTRTDAQVNFEWGTSSPDAALGADTFSVRWSGLLLVPETGSYTFSTLNSDGVRLYVNGSPVIDQFANQDINWNDSSPLHLTEGQMLEIQMDYFKSTGPAVAKLKWTGPSFAGVNGDIIGSQWLFDGAGMTRTPYAFTQSLTVSKNTPQEVALAGCGGTLTYSVVTPPAHGTLTGTAPNLTFTPFANYIGLDSFTFKVNNGTRDSAPAAVSINVIPDEVVYLADSLSVNTAENQPFADTRLGTGFDSGNSIVSGTTTVGSALTYTLSNGVPDGRFLSGISPFNNTTNTTSPSVVYHLSTARNLNGLLFWNYSEIWDGVNYSARGLTRADITIVHSGGTTKLEDIAFARSPATGSTPTTSAQMVNFGATYTGVTSIRFDELRSTQGEIVGWTRVAFTYSASAPVVHARAGKFRPGQPWPDEKGVHINAHGGGVLFHEGTYYWCGQFMIEGAAGNTAQVGVSMYSSQDLHHWKNEGIALAVSEDPQSEIVKGCILERPKVIFNRKTGKFVMWFHLELKDQSYSAARSGVAVADKVTGPYQYLGSFRPNAGVWPSNVPEELKKPHSDAEADALSKIKFPGGPAPDYPKESLFRLHHEGGQMARDMNLFVDDDGIAYHLYSSEHNGTLHISQLTDDYLKPAGKYVRIFPGGFHEAPAMFKHKGRYYLLSSGCTGWNPNPARLASADNIFGPWTELGDPCIGPEEETKVTFGSQPTWVLPVQGKPGAFIYMGDRWTPSNPIDATHIWLPIKFDPDGQPFLKWMDQWDLGFFDSHVSAAPPTSAAFSDPAARADVPASALGWPMPDPKLDAYPGFRSPPPGYGQVPFWWWTGEELNAERLIGQLRELQRKGVSGVQVNYSHIDTPGWLTDRAEPPLFTDAWWDIYGQVSAAAAKLDMGIGLSTYTIDWPNGQKNLFHDLFYSKPENNAFELKHGLRRRAKGGEAIVAGLSADRVAVRAYPVVDDKPGQGGVDLVDFVKDNQLDWTAPEGTWEIWEFVSARQPGTMNPLMPGAGEVIVQGFFQEFENRNPGGGAKGLNFFFNDELHIGLGKFAWHEDFAEQFALRKGYDLLGALPAMWLDAGDITPKVRMDFADVRMALMEERYFKPIYDWHASRGLIFGCDSGGRGLNPQEFGDYFRATRWYTAPGHDTPGGKADPIKGKVSSSIANLYRQPRVWLEAYHSLGWQAAPEQLMFATRENYLYGCTLFSLHGLYYTTFGSHWEWAPPSYHFRMPYWEHMDVFLGYFDRLSYLLSQGHFVADVAIVYPVAPYEAELNGDAARNAAFDLGTRLMQAGINFEFIDNDSLARAVVRNGRLEVEAAGASYQALVFPNMQAVHWPTIEKAAAFAEAGGKVYAVGDLPAASDHAGRNDPKLVALNDRAFSADHRMPNPAATVDAIRDAFVQDVQGLNRPVRALHRKVGPREVYMVMDAHPGDAVYFRAHGAVELWDAWTGERRPLRVLGKSETGTQVELELQPHESQLVVFTPDQPHVNPPLPEPPPVLQKVLDGDWTVAFVPTMDNTYGDFRLPATEENRIIGVEARRFAWAPETSELREAAPRTETDDKAWPRKLHGYGTRFYVLGPVPEAVPEAELDAHLAALRDVNPAVPVKIGDHELTWRPYDFSWRYGIEGNPGHQGYHGLKGRLTDDFIGLGRDAGGHNETRIVPHEGGGRYYLWTTVTAPAATQAEIVTGPANHEGRNHTSPILQPAAVYVGGQRLADLVAPFDLPAGRHPLLVRYNDGGRGHMVVRRHGAPEPAERTPLALQWYDDPAVLPMDVVGTKSPSPEWFRFVSTPGTKAIQVTARGRVKAWIDGKPMRDHGRGKFDIATAPTHAAVVALRVEPEPGWSGGAALVEPVAVETDGTGRMPLGDWSQMGILNNYSGGVRYSTTFTLTEEEAKAGIQIDLSQLSATAEVSLNGEPIGVRVAPPWRFDVAGQLKPGENKLEVLIYNTLSNHYQTIPSHYRGNPLSGLIGPVRLMKSKE